MSQEYGEDIAHDLRDFARVWIGPGEVPGHSEDFVAGHGRGEGAAALRAILQGPPGRSVAVLGEPGVGRSTVIREAARRLCNEGWVVIEATSADVNAGMTFVGELEGRVQAIARAGYGRRLLWVLPDLDAAVYAGAFTGDPRGLLDKVMSYVERGEILLAAEVDLDTWTSVSQMRPRVRSLIEPVRLEPLGGAETMRMASAWLERRGWRARPETLEEALELAGEHLPESAPGSLLGVVARTQERLARRGEDGGEVARRELLSTISSRTGLPLDLLDASSRLDLEVVRGFFEERILGQPEAVALLVERVALIKAGLTDPERPLGVFLFVGPTGTGKTELAKTLAQFLFGSAKRLVRLDLSEYQTPESLERLLAGPEAPEAAPLISAVRSQPFSVILLDEIEKAHPNVWDVFLQLFDAGRLTDRSGKTADFRHCVVIMTSNIGTRQAGAHSVGFGADSRAPSPSTVKRAVDQTFRPEFINRIDRIVVFRGLGRDVMRRLIRNELGEVAGRRGLRSRPWAVEWDDSTIDFLVEHGFTSDLGARPLKRAVEDSVLAPLARAIVERQVPSGDQFLLVRSPGGRKIEVQFVDPDTDEVETLGEEAPAPDRPTLKAIVAGPDGSPAEVGFLREQMGEIGARIKSETFAERKRAVLSRLGDEDLWASPERFDVLGEAELRDRLEAGFATAGSLLERLFHSRRDVDGASRRLARLLAQRLYVLDAALDGLDAREPSDAFVTVHSADGDREDGSFAARLIEMYRRWADARGMRTETLGEGLGKHVVLAVSGFGSYPILVPEAGVHLLETPSGRRSYLRRNVHVLIAPQPVEPPNVVSGGREEQARRAIAGVGVSPTVVRRYREGNSPLVRDSVRGWRTGRLDRVLAGDFDLF